MPIRRKALLVSLLLGSLLLMACPQRESINNVLADPSRYRNKDVAVAGRVTNSYGVLGEGFYEVDDGTGKIWVMTRRGAPGKNAEVGLKGVVHTGFTIGGRSFGTIIEETDRKGR